MTARRPEYTRPYSKDYFLATGREVRRLMDARNEYVDAAYVAWVERELQKARGK
jgi:hypothetical protein